MFDGLFLLSIAREHASRSSALASQSLNSCPQASPASEAFLLPYCPDLSVYSSGIHSRCGEHEDGILEFDTKLHVLSSVAALRFFQQIPNAASWRLQRDIIDLYLL